MAKTISLPASPMPVRLEVFLQFSFSNIVFMFLLHCVVPENIHTPPRKGLEFPGGVGGSKAQENPEGGGVLYQFLLFFPDRFHYSYMLNFLFAFCLPIRGRKH